MIVSSLKSKAMQPQALVQISKSVSNTVTVTGDVTGGGVVPLSPKGTRILEVIAYAGGIRAPAYETLVSLTRNDVTATVPFAAIITADPNENVYVRPGDVITNYAAHKHSAPLAQPAAMPRSRSAETSSN